MAKNPDHLIVYGTLRPPFANPFARFLHQHSQYVGEATFPGLLFDLGTYPGARYQPGSVAQVTGTVYDISTDKQRILAYLDDYEGISNPSAQSDEYSRTVIPVNCRDAVMDCWVYLYNLPTAGKPVIEWGNYALHCGLVG